MARDSTRADNWNREVTTTMRQLKQRHLKRQLACNSYTVDPEQVAVAIIVKLAQGSPGAGPGDPTRGARAPFRLRQAA
jgi:hypothetical protein